MLEFEKATEDCYRVIDNTGFVICLIIFHVGSWILKVDDEDVDLFLEAIKLRQIADKLDELNKS